MRHTRRRGIVCLLAAAFFVLAGCGTAWQYDPITDIGDLEGRRVGVSLSWEADYYLTGRPDMELYRYDSLADMFMALRYDKVDALAMDDLLWKIVKSLSEGVDIVEPAFGECGYCLYFGSDDRALKEDFDRFLAEYKQTQEYEDFLTRLEEFDGEEYIGPDIPLTGTGDTIRVAIELEGFPRTFWDPDMDEPIGYDIEAFKRYANARGCRIAFFLSSYDDAVMGLQNGLYDVFAGYLSDVYREGVEAVGLCTSDNIYESPLYFIQKTQADIEVCVEDLE